MWGQYDPTDGIEMNSVIDQIRNDASGIEREKKDKPRQGSQGKMLGVCCGFVLRVVLRRCLSLCDAQSSVGNEKALFKD